MYFIHIKKKKRTKKNNNDIKFEKIFAIVKYRENAYLKYAYTILFKTICNNDK